MMETINELMDDFKSLLARGRIQKAYRYIFDIFTDLSNALKNGTTGTIFTNALYHGYLDMTYLPVITSKLKEHGLKIAVVFNYASFQFEIWLSAVNRKKREEVLPLFSDKKLKKYKIVKIEENADAIIEHPVKGIDDFGKKDAVVSTIVKVTMAFIDDIEEFITDRK